MLKNRSIISTRPSNGVDRMVSLFQEAGARLISLPLIAIEKNELSEEEEILLNNLKSFDWLVFTSKNGVYYFFKHWNDIFHGKNLPKSLKTAAVGATTKDALLKFGIEPSLVSTGKTSVDLLEQLKDQIKDDEELKILLSLGTLARSVLEDGLKSLVSVSRMNVYKTVPSQNIDQKITQDIKDDQYDLILLTSPSAFYSLKECMAPFSVKELRFACIGPTTENALTEDGIKPMVVAETSTANGLFKSVKNYFELTHI